MVGPGRKERGNMKLAHIFGEAYKSQTCRRQAGDTGNFNQSSKTWEPEKQWHKSQSIKWHQGFKLRLKADENQCPGVGGEAEANSSSWLIFNFYLGFLHPTDKACPYHGGQQASLGGLLIPMLISSQSTLEHAKHVSLRGPVKLTHKIKHPQWMHLYFFKSLFLWCNQSFGLLAKIKHCIYGYDRWKKSQNHGTQGKNEELF